MVELLVTTNILNARRLREIAKSFIWFNNENHALKCSWKNLPPKFLMTAFELMFEIEEWKSNPIGELWRSLGNYTHKPLTHEEICILTIKNKGLPQDKIIIDILLGGSPLMVVEIRKFIYAHRRTRFMINAWKNVRLCEPQTFLKAGRIIFNLDNE